MTTVWQKVLCGKAGEKKKRIKKDRNPRKSLLSFYLPSLTKGHWFARSLLSVYELDKVQRVSKGRKVSRLPCSSFLESTWHSYCSLLPCLYIPVYNPVQWNPHFWLWVGIGQGSRQLWSSILYSQAK